MSYEELIYKHFDVRSVSGDELMCICVFHDDSNASMQVNADTGLWLCFSCDAKGGPVTLFEEVGVNITSGQENLDIQDVILKINKLRKPEPKEEERIYRDDYLSQFSVVPIDYWEKGRGFSKKTVQAFELGYDMLSDSATIPIRNIEGQLLGVIRRAFNPSDDEPRYKYPLKFKRSHHLFGEWRVEADPTATHVVLTEGSLDAIRVTEAGYNGMAIYGSSISETQVRVLRRLGVLRVTLFFDDDAAGRKARDRCLGQVYNRRRGKVVKDYRPELDLRRFFVVDCVRYPTTPLMSHKENGEEAFDPGDMKLRDIDRLLHRTTTTL